MAGKELHLQLNGCCLGLADLTPRHNNGFNAYTVTVAKMGPQLIIHDENSVTRFIEPDAVTQRVIAALWQRVVELEDNG